MQKISVLLLLLILSCGPKESFQQTFPIPIKDYSYSKIGNQLIFTIEFENEIPSSLLFKTLYFQNQALTQQEIKPNQDQFKAASKTMILESNPINEYGNEPPLKTNLPFNLAISEAVLVYKFKKKVQHYKFRNVVEKANQ